jgi:hypothetical protein
MVGFDILFTVIPSCAGSVCEDSMVSKLRQSWDGRLVSAGPILHMICAVKHEPQYRGRNKLMGIRFSVDTHDRLAMIQNSPTRMVGMRREPWGVPL